MIATGPKDSLSINLNSEPASVYEIDASVINIKTPSQLLLPNRIVTHHPKAGLNPVADAASHLFSVLGKLKTLTTYRQLEKLQQELIQEVNSFQDTVKTLGYNAEYVIVCKYILCATFDDIISNTNWGAQGQWDCYNLLAAFNQDTQHQNKFFSIMERAIKEPSHYIDLMEVMYICLSMGYKGQYRTTEHSQYQLEQITNTLYKHIRAYRGSFSKTLSPSALRSFRTVIRTASTSNLSIVFILLTTVCIVMTIFVSLGYLMDVISNEAYKNVAQIQRSVSTETT